MFVLSLAEGGHSRDLSQLRADLTQNVGSDTQMPPDAAQETNAQCRANQGLGSTAAPPLPSGEGKSAIPAVMKDGLTISTRCPNNFLSLSKKKKNLLYRSLLDDLEN